MATVTSNENRTAWGIVADSSCDLRGFDGEAKEVDFAKVPFAINIGGKEYIDDENLDLSQMLNDMESCSEIGKTSCPSPHDWYELFKRYDNVIAITISANLSGSYNSAEAARKLIAEDYPNKKVYVLNSRSAGSALSMYAEKASELIQKDLSFEEIVPALEEYLKGVHTIFTLASFGNLVKNGRINRFSGFIAGKLGIWGVGIGSSEGTIIVKEKTRGVRRVIESVINDMKENGFSGGYVIVSHCQNPDAAEQLEQRIKEIWRNTTVKILPTGGLCGFYAERRGLIVAY